MVKKEPMMWRGNVLQPNTPQNMDQTIASINFSTSDARWRDIPNHVRRIDSLEAQDIQRRLRRKRQIAEELKRKKKHKERK